MSIEEVKLRYRNESGTLLQSPVKLEYKGGRIWFVESPFALKNEIKAMAGARWHGYQDPPIMQWSVDDCQRNRFQIEYLKNGDKVYAHFDQPIKRHDYSRPLMEHQKDLADYILTYHYTIMAAEMRCVDGDARIPIRRNGLISDVALSELHSRLDGLDGGWNPKNSTCIPTYVLSFVDGTLQWNLVCKSLSRGVQQAVRVRLVNGLSLIVTPDHEIYTAIGRVAAGDLGPGQLVRVSQGPQQLAALVMVSNVASVGYRPVYDLVCADPYRSFVADGFVVHNCGKTLSTQEVMERSGVKHWYWIGPLTSLPNMRREFKKWSIDPSLNIEMFNYEALVKIMKEWGDRPVPQGLVVDESSRCKGPTSQRSNAVQELADKIRDKYGLDGYVIEMSGTPSPKSPLDWWKPCEIAYPGFLKEGSVKAMEQRLAYLTQHSYDAGVFSKRTGWRDDENKCHTCGEYADHENHEIESPLYHPFERSKNEVAYLYERLKGLVIIKHLKDCVGLPTKTYRQIICKPSSSLLRAADAISQAAPNAITVPTRLRELSDGFQYQDIKDGTTPCTNCTDGLISEWYDPDDEERVFKSVDMMGPDIKLTERRVPCSVCGGTRQMPRIVRTVKEIPCPKDKALKGLLEECEETGRIVVFAGFTGSVDRVESLCLKQGWDVVKCDGRGWLVTTATGTQVIDEEPLDYWANMDHSRVAFVSHPESGGMSLTLRESRMVVFWSNSFKTEYRIQAEARIQSIGEDKPGLLIVDLFHLPTDRKVLDVIRENRKLELLTMGEISEAMNWQNIEGEFEVRESC
jgi:hypothetical protein